MDAPLAGLGSEQGLAQRAERRADVFREQLRLLPSGEVPAPVVLVVVETNMFGRVHIPALDAATEWLNSRVRRTSAVTATT